MASLRQGLTPQRRWAGMALVLLLFLGAVLYYRSSVNTPVPASSTGDGIPLPPTSTVARTPGGDDRSASPSPAIGPITVLGQPVRYAEPNETVLIRGVYRGAPNTFLTLEVREHTTWKPRPVRPKTDWMGRFVTHVELGEAGPHWIRVVDPGSGLVSEEIVVSIEG